VKWTNENYIQVAQIFSRPFHGLQIKTGSDPTDESVGYCHSVRFADVSN
jgi:hypothetical protein